MPPSPQSKRWTFTLNNPTDEESPDLVHEKLAEQGYKYLVFQKEVGSDNTPHYQGING